MEHSPVSALVTVPAFSVAFWPGLRSGVFAPPSRLRLWTVWPWCSTLRVRGGPGGDLDHLGVDLHLLEHDRDGLR
jgi:hypothetical protein